MINYKETDCVNKYRMPSIKRTLQDVEKLYKDKTANIQTFYSDKFLNNRGSIIDAAGNRVVVTDWIAKQLIKDNLLENIGCICSPLPYLVDHPEKVEDSSPKTKGDREEEKVAHRLYERKDYSNSDIDIFIDYQVPILRKKESKAEREKNKDKKTRKPGKVDLIALSEDKKEIYLMELKKHNAQNNNDESTREMRVRVFDLNGLKEYEDVKIVRIISKDYNLLIMKDYLPIIGEIDGNVDIKSEKEEVNFKNIKAFYMNSNNEFNLMIREVGLENGK